MAYYVICDDDSKHEGMTKEQILAAIAQAIETGSIGDCDTGFVTKLKDTNGGRSVTVWVGTQAQYNALSEITENCLYIITDDTTMEELEAAIAKAQNSADDLAKAVTALHPVDITSAMSVTLGSTYDASKVVDLYVNTYSMRFTYSPVLKMVFFYIPLQFEGSFEADDMIPIIVKGSHMPPYRYGNGVVNINNIQMSGELSRTGDDEIQITLRIPEAFTKSVVGNGDILQGWYFCDGE